MGHPLSSSRASSVPWSVVLTIFAFICAWIFAFHLQVRSGATPVYSSPSASTTPIVIVGEADVTTTVAFKEEQDLFLPPTILVTTTIAGLRSPDMAFMKRLTGDPKPQKGERVIRVPVFMYHRIRPFRTTDTARERVFTVTPESFELQLRDLIQQGYHFVTPAELEGALANGDVLPPQPVLLTFDDGLREHYTVVFPLLKKYQAKATYFVITGANQLSGYLKDTMIKELDESGIVTIASHTEQHPYLARMSAASRVKEIVGAKRTLEDLLGHPIEAFAYPYGSWNEQIAKEVENAGYTLGFGVRLGSRHTPSRRYELRRIRVLQGERLSAYAGGL